MAVSSFAQGNAGAGVRRKQQEVVRHFGEFVGFREYGGANRGWLPDAGNRLCGVPLGSFWCASSMYYGFHTATPCITAVRSAWVPSWHSKKSGLVVTHDRRWVLPPNQKPYLKPGCLFTIYFASKKRDAHIGMVEKVSKDSVSFTTLEGNASNGLSRNGDGFYRNTRRTATVSKCLCPPELLTPEEFIKFFIEKPYKIRR